MTYSFKNTPPWGTRVAQLVADLTLNFGSGHNLTVYGIKPHIGLCADGADPAWDSLYPPPLSAPTLLVLALFLSISK